MDPISNADKRESRGSSISSTSTVDSGNGASGSALRRRGSLFELVTGRPEPGHAARSLSGSDNAINTRHRGLDTRLVKAPPPLPLPPRRLLPNVTIVRPTKEARKAEIVAAVTRRLYTARKKPEPRAEPPPSLTENAEETDQTEPKELKLCSNARARLQEISKRAIALGLHRRLRKDCDTQTESLRSALRVKEKSVSTDEPTKEVAVETATVLVEANFDAITKHVEVAEKSSQWTTESASVGTQAMTPMTPIYPLYPHPAVYVPPFWMNTWWPNIPWGAGTGMQCCHHEPIRKANVSAVDCEETFSDDSLDSLCGITRVPDGASGDTGTEQKPALWETMTLRSGNHFKDSSQWYQPDVFKKPNPLASIFPPTLYLNRQDKSTGTESDENHLKETGCNTDPINDEPLMKCPIHGVKSNNSDQPLVKNSFRLPSAIASEHFQVVCDFTIACHTVRPSNAVTETTDPIQSQCECRRDPLGKEQTESRRPITLSSEPVVTAQVPGETPPGIVQPAYGAIKTNYNGVPPVAPPDIIAQARNDGGTGGSLSKNCADNAPVLTTNGPLQMRQLITKPDGESSCVANEREKACASLDSTFLSQPDRAEDSSRAKSLESLFQSSPNYAVSYQNDDRDTATADKKESRPTSGSVKKFRLPYLTENAGYCNATVTARSLDGPPQYSSLTIGSYDQRPAKQITPSSFLSPKGRRLLLQWLNNPGSSPSAGATSVRSTRKAIRGKIIRRSNGRKENNQRKTAAALDGGKVLIYHNLSLLLGEATNYVRNITQSRSETRPKSRPSTATSKDRSQKEFATQTDNTADSMKNVCFDPGDSIRRVREISIQTDSADTHTSQRGNTESLVKESIGTQCDLFQYASQIKPLNTLVLFSISRSTQTDVFLWNDGYDFTDDVLLQAQSMIYDEPMYESLPYYLPASYPKLTDKTVDICEMSLYQNRSELLDIDLTLSSVPNSYNRVQNQLSPESNRHSRLPCQHSSPRLYLQHLVSLRRGVVEASQTPPTRPTGVG